MNDVNESVSSTGAQADVRSILDSAHEAFISMDAGGFITEWNREAEVTFGWPRSEAVGKVLADLIIPERYRERHWHGLQRYLETGEGPVIDKRIEIEALHREGFEFPVELTISAQAAGASHSFNAFLHDISDRRRAALFMDIQYAVTRILAGADREQEVIAGVLRELGERMNWEYGGVWRMDEESDRLVCIDVWTADASAFEPFAAASKELSLELEEGLPGRVWASGHPAFIPDVGSDSNFPRGAAADDVGLHAAICFPLVSSGTVDGVVEFFSRTIAQADEKLLEILGSIGTQVGQHLAVLRERSELLTRMERMARTDELTGLPNRRAWEEALEREMARAGRDGTRFSVALIDLDHFKAFNDTHGHPAGDELLKQAGAVWKPAIRASDFIARYGGEEFALLLPGCPPGSTATVVERLRAVTPMDQTCSAGVASWDGRESAEELIARADGALYEAKRTGRDRTQVA